MKKKILLAISVVLCLTLTVMVFVGCNNDNPSAVSDEPVAELSTWMSMINDDTLVKEIVIPGSHDSGTVGMMSSAETQDKTYAEQLVRGIRYFDTRVMHSDGEYYMYHTIKGKMKYSQVLADVKAFLQANPSEFIVLDYQHMDGGNESVIFDMLEEELGDKLVNVDGDDNLAFIEALTVGEIRGKCLIFVGREQNQLDRPYQMPRDKDAEARAGSALRSYYISSYNRSDSEKYIEKYIPEYINMYKNSQGGMFVLQGQLTHKFIGDLKNLENGHSANMNKYTYDLYNSEDLKYINIIMRDFVNCEKSAIILRLNVAKNNVKQDKLEDYKTMLKNYTTV